MNRFDLTVALTPYPPGGSERFFFFGVSGSTVFQISIQQPALQGDSTTRGLNITETRTVEPGCLEYWQHADRNKNMPAVPGPR
jgi:hypothetical protein